MVHEKEANPEKSETITCWPGYTDEPKNLQIRFFLFCHLLPIIIRFSGGPVFAGLVCDGVQRSFNTRKKGFV